MLRYGFEKGDIAPRASAIKDWSTISATSSEVDLRMFARIVRTQSLCSTT
jgi:hypothetical protein